MAMTFTDALIYSILGLLTVFFALALLMVIIKLIIVIGDRKQAAAPEAEPEPLPVKQAEPAPGAAGELKLYDTDPRTAAMLMAIVADELQVPINELRFISIREVRNDEI